MRNSSNFESNAYQQPIFAAGNSHRNPIFDGVKKTPKLMEIAVILLNWFGASSLVLLLFKHFSFLNAALYEFYKWLGAADSWKMTFIFSMSAIFLIIKAAKGLSTLIFYIIDKIDAIKERRKKIIKLPKRK